MRAENTNVCRPIAEIPKSTCTISMSISIEVYSSCLLLPVSFVYRNVTLFVYKRGKKGANIKCMESHSKCAVVIVLLIVYLYETYRPMFRFSITIYSYSFFFCFSLGQVYTTRLGQTFITEGYQTCIVRPYVYFACSKGLTAHQMLWFETVIVCNRL